MISKTYGRFIYVLLSHITDNDAVY